MSTTESPASDLTPLLTAMLNMTAFHREHEKFYSSSPREQAVTLQRHSRTLHALADQWMITAPSTTPAFSPYEGAPDLNAAAALQLDGVLFMEGEGEPGEITYRGGVMFRGYWNDEPATLATLRGGWVHSGDIGRFDEDGFLYIVDRKKDMVISGGENIYSREVEQALVRHPAVREAAVIGVPDPRFGEAVRAVVVLRAGSAATQDALIEHCRTLIASYKKPRSVVFTDDLPKLGSGKVDKNRIRALHGGASPSNQGKP